MTHSNKICFVLIAGFSPDNLPVLELKNTLEKKGFDAVTSGFFGQGDVDDFQSLTIAECTENIAQMIKEVKHTHQRAIGIGISLGGAFLLEHAKKHNDLDGIISIGTPFRLKNLRLINIGKILFPLFYPVWKRLQRIKKLRLFPIGAGITVVNYLQHDFIVGLEEISMPVLFMHSKKDVVTDPAAVAEFFPLISSAKKQHLYFDNGNHVIDNDPEVIIANTFDFFDLPNVADIQVAENADVMSTGDLALTYADYNK